MSVFSSLTNRIFIASAILVLVSISVPMYFVISDVTEQSETQLRSSLNEAASLVDEYGRAKFEDFVRLARLVADLPKLKAAVAEDDLPTVAPIALDYQRQVQADLFVVTGKTGALLAQLGPCAPDAASLSPTLRAHASDRETTWLWMGPHCNVLRLAAIPLLLPGPERLGTLVVGFRVDQAMARIKNLTNSDIALIAGNKILDSTLTATADLAGTVTESGIFARTLGGVDYIGRVQPLGISGDSGGQAVALVLRSRTAQQQLLGALYRRIGMAAIGAVLVATLLGYAIARTVTRPLRALTGLMREIAVTGDLARTVPTVGPWDDEDVRLLAGTFHQLTTALDRFQREAAQRERLSSLGRLSTVIAHEVRNPLMIIKTALRSLRRGTSPEVIDVANNIDEEVSRLNRVVTDVLDFARPIRFDVEGADLVEVCRDAAQAAQAGPEDVAIAVDAGEARALVRTDVERLRGVLVNVLTNAQHAVRGRNVNGGTPPLIQLRTMRAEGGRWRIEVTDRGVGIPAADLPRLFEPFFTTRRTGSGLGLALARNVIDGLGGSIVIDSELNVGTTVRIEIPEK